jgi:hypothetical protein
MALPPTFQHASLVDTVPVLYPAAFTYILIMAVSALNPEIKAQC